METLEATAGSQRYERSSKFCNFAVSQRAGERPSRHSVGHFGVAATRLRTISSAD